LLCLAKILDQDAAASQKSGVCKNKQGKYAGGSMLLRKPTDEANYFIEKLLKDESAFLDNKGKESKNSGSFVYGGIYFKDRDERVYPSGRVLCHALGFMKDEDPAGVDVIRDDILLSAELSYPLMNIFAEKKGGEFRRWTKSGGKWSQMRRGNLLRLTDIALFSD